jgi:hypothetical protein
MKKSLKIPKKKSEAVIRRTDNTMVKRYQRGNQIKDKATNGG